jgi:hypothetical protein
MWHTPSDSTTRHGRAAFWPRQRRRRGIRDRPGDRVLVRRRHDWYGVGAARRPGVWGWMRRAGRAGSHPAADRTAPTPAAGRRHQPKPIGAAGRSPLSCPLTRTVRGNRRVARVFRRSLRVPYSQRNVTAGRDGDLTVPRSVATVSRMPGTVSLTRTKSAPSPSAVPSPVAPTSSAILDQRRRAVTRAAARRRTRAPWESWAPDRRRGRS